MEGQTDAQRIVKDLEDACDVDFGKYRPMAVNIINQAANFLDRVDAVCCDAGCDKLEASQIAFALRACVKSARAPAPEGEAEVPATFKQWWNRQDSGDRELAEAAWQAGRFALSVTTAAQPSVHEFDPGRIDTGICQHRETPSGDVCGQKWDYATHKVSEQAQPDTPAGISTERRNQLWDQAQATGSPDAYGLLIEHELEATIPNHQFESALNDGGSANVCQHCPFQAIHPIHKPSPLS